MDLREADPRESRLRNTMIVSAGYRRLFMLAPPATQWTPQHVECVFFCRQAASENALRVLPPGEAARCRLLGTHPPTKEAAPNICQVVCRFPEDRFRNAPRRSAVCCFCSGPGIRFAGYPVHHRSQHTAGKTRILSRRSRNGLLPQSRQRDLPAADHCANEYDTPRPVRPLAECSRTSPQAFQIRC